MPTAFLWGNLNEEDRLADPRVNWRKILELVLKNGLGIRGKALSGSG